MDLPAHEGEQQFVLRIEDADLAARLKAALSSETGSVEGLELVFPPGSERQGALKLGEEQYTVSVKDLPTLVESYKTLDDTNLVKTVDVGQILIVSKGEPDGNDGPSTSGASKPATSAARSADKDADEDDDVEDMDNDRTHENKDGVTPPMHNVRERCFRPEIKTDPQLVSAVEEQMTTILQGQAPQGWRFHDVEEIYALDTEIDAYRWMPLEDHRQQQAAQAAREAHEEEAIGAAVAEDSLETQSDH